MSVATLLAKKQGSTITIHAETIIAEAVSILADHKIGALVVVDDGNKVIGILSERDVVRGLAAKGASVLTQNVSDLMTAPVKTCTRSESADDVMRRMSKGRFRHMPVVEGDKLVGVVSIGDVVQNRINALEQEAGAMRDYIMTG
ncbi:MAG: inosine-5-monophosphate dehydrogenase [Rhodospirillaceae bacterium]|jgi:CBS domain-containing protein|uniref:CBS domain-containing protein n=1 Tax=unclassified Hwanghaeella TaxID=2605944 RepID=UPI000C3F09CA|nr:inosine-5-monophosphate dehydrogenase [Rhodospirillales bacterium]MAX48474.1 inosine-5-monophosphate dehydrogenase [Rhodospirillaceae bacterium]|tara:strand:+ start:115727 stop:116158 length:432 start_codon:yes stop_codon:yes gene_type:complete